MRMGCHCPRPAPLTGYIYPVMTRRGLRGLRGMGQSDAAVLVAGGPGALASAVGTPPLYDGMTYSDYVAAFGYPPGTLDASAPQPASATNAQGQTMADILAAGGSPAQLGPTYDTSQTGAAIAGSMQTSAVGYAYGAGLWDSFYSLLPGLPAGGPGAPSLFGSVPWWVWAGAGAVGIVMLADAVKK